jgi:hypothetical protein
MAFVKPVVEVAFTTNPGTVPGGGAWTDISQWCMNSMEWVQGRDVELDSASTATLTLVLDNRDRRFDPKHSAGPYFGNLKARRRIRVTISGTLMFTGFIDGWPQAYSDFSRTSTVTIRANDPMSFLATAKITGTPYELQVGLDAPISWYPLDEVDSLQARNIMDVKRAGQYANEGVKLNQPAGGIWENAPLFTNAGRPGGTAASPQPAESKGFGVALGDPLLGAGFAGNSTVEYWEKIYPAGIAGYGQRDYGVAVHLCSTTGNTTKLAYIDNSVVSNRSTFGTTGGRAIDDGSWHHVVMTYDGSQRLFYVDGSLDATVGGATPLFGTNTGFIGHYWGSISTNTFFWNVVDVLMQPIHLRHIAYYNYALSPAQVADHYNAALGFPEDYAGSRVARILDYAGWPNTERVLDAGASRLQAQRDPFSGYALGYIQEVVKAERGNFYSQPDGKLRFRSRHYEFLDTGAKTSQATFGDDSTDLRYKDIQPADDQLFVINDVVSQVKGGRTFSKVNQASIDTYFRRSLELTGLLNLSDAEAEVMCQWITARYNDPGARISSLVLDARFDANVQAQAIARKLGDKITVKFKQMATGSQITYVQLIEQIKHAYDWSELTWTVDLSLSPADTATPFVIGTDLVGSGSKVMVF